MSKREFWKAAYLAEIGSSEQPAAAATKADQAVAALEHRYPTPPSSLDEVQVIDIRVGVGERVQVLRYEPPAEGQDGSPLDYGWGGPWTMQHELSVSSFLDVIAIYMPGNGVVLSNGLSYPPSCLVGEV